MKNVIITILLFVSFSMIYAQDVDKKALLEKEWEISYEKKVIPKAEIGDLIAIDEFGKYIIATGGEFEEIKGFTTNVPYVTPNKPLTKEGSRVDFIGILSLESGVVFTNDYLCPSSTIPGKVKKCTKNDNPYAVAQEEGSADLQKIKVKVLGRHL